MYKTQACLLLFLAFFQLLCYSQNETAYSYDSNRNLIADHHKGITSITYNLLNLPKTILYEDGRKIEYTYTASGVKLSQKAYQADGSLAKNKSYFDGIVYANQDLEFVNHADGYLEPNNSGNFDYIYQHKDHLENIRLSFADVNNNHLIEDSEIRESNDYYPFGLKTQKENHIITGRDHPYGFGGKEEQDIFDLNWHDFGARMYDAALGRWHILDPKAEKYYPYSPYNYTLNNPIKFVDPDGKDVEIAGTSSKLKESVKLLKKTPTGKKLFNAAAGNKNIQVRISSVSNFKAYDDFIMRQGVKYFDVQQAETFAVDINKKTNNKVTIEDPNFEKAFKGATIKADKKSGKETVYYIVISEDVNDVGKMTELLGHELGAMVLTREQYKLKIKKKGTIEVIETADGNYRSLNGIGSGGFGSTGEVNQQGEVIKTPGISEAQALAKEIQQVREKEKKNENQ